MSSSCDGGSNLPSNENDDSDREDPIAVSSSGGGDDSDAPSRFDLVGSVVVADWASVAEADRSVEPRGSDSTELSVDVKFENDESKMGGGSEAGVSEKQPSSIAPSDSGEKKTDLQVVKTEQKKVKLVGEDYNSILSEFDQFTSKGAGEAVGYGYEIGDMVWGKVKSHPWWPGYIYNEAFATPSVGKTKRNGHVLVAFFGDSSYGWFELAELVPFAENFLEKSRQTNSRGFLKAVEEAVGEFSRRRTLALACCCRNQFNFWPSKVEGYYVVDVGDFEPGVYSLSQIHQAREDFQPKEMLSFVVQLALWPRTNQHGKIEFTTNKATVLACRRAMFEEFDETYAQAFGSTPVRPPRPTVPMAVDPAKAPLSGPLVFAEALGKGKVSAKRTKTKESIENKYILKRRDEPMNLKKANAGKASSPAHPFLLDGSSLTGMQMESTTEGHIHHFPASGMNDSQLQAMNHQVSMSCDVKPLEGSRKIVEGGIKKVKGKKQTPGEPDTDNLSPVEKKKKRKKDASTERPAGKFNPASVNAVEKKKKRKKEMKNETDANLLQLPLAISNGGLTVEKASGMLVDDPLVVNNQLDTEKDVVMMSPSSTIKKQEVVERRKLEFSMLLNDLRALALNPYHGAERRSPATVQQVFLKFRSLVYQKSFVLFQSENEKSEATTSTLPVSTAPCGPTEKPKDKPKKLMRHPGRLDDPTKGGKKRGPSDRPEVAKKKKRLADDSLNIEKKKPVDSEGIKKKKTAIEMKSVPVEKKVSQRPSETQRENIKSIASKNVLSTSTKGVKLESSKRTEVPPAKASNKPAMLVMKFPTDASLPSGVELRAKFTRFGPMDHSATRVFWKSYTCRLVFRRRADADAALKYALSTNNLFGNTNVRSYVRDVEVDAPEPEPVRVQRDESSFREARAAARPVPPMQAPPPPQHAVPVKSCLKKPAGEEGGNGNSNGSGSNNGRGTSRVKFVFGGEGCSGSNKGEQVSSSTTYAQHSMDVSSSKNLAKLIPESSGEFQSILPINMLPASSASAEPSSHILSSSASPSSPSLSSVSTGIRQMGSRPPPPNNDISQQFLNLLTRCSDVVNSLSVVLGYVPYHSL